MISPRRSSPRLANRRRCNLAFLRKLKKATQFTIADVTKCVHAPEHHYTTTFKHSVYEQANLNHLTRNPLLTLRCYKKELRACLQAGNPDAHFIEGVKQYFAFDKRKGLKHLQLAANNNQRLGMFLYAIILLITGQHEEGKSRMDLLNWRINLRLADKCWQQLEQALLCVPIKKKRDYGAYMRAIKPRPLCMLKHMEDRCIHCYYYKQMQMFLKMIT